MGRVHQINSSQGGVPKLPIESGTVDESGLVGDLQADREHHGRPWQALCLYSLEVIEKMQDEGHPIQPGSAGENLTISGLDWADLGEGDRLRIGEGIVAEITGPASPCSKNAAWFIDGDFLRMSEHRYPGEARLYARVVSGGPVTVGDPVSVIR